MKITLSKGGTKERTIEVEQIQIPDLWHIAQAESDLDCRRAILTAWHLAHDMKKVLIECTAHDELLEALRYYVAAHEAHKHEMPETNENEGKVWLRTLEIV